MEDGCRPQGGCVSVDIHSRRHVDALERSVEQVDCQGLKLGIQGVHTSEGKELEPRMYTLEAIMML